MSIGENIKFLRSSRGISLDNLAKHVGVSKPHLWALERGESCNPSISTVKSLASFFDVSIDELCDEVPDPSEYAKLCSCGSVNFSLRLDRFIECNSCGKVDGLKWV